MRVIFLCLLCGLFPLKAMADDLVVFAAASLKGPLDAIIANSDGVVVSYAGSGTLARQVSAGAPADVVLLANAAWTDVLDADGHIIDPVEFTGNRLVLVGQTGMDAVPLTVEGLTAALDGGRLAMGFTQSVPAGIYGQAALETLGLWGGLRSAIVETQSVRAALALVARGEAPLGIVYQSDALIAPDLPIVARFAVTSHPRIAYFAAVTTTSTHPDAAAFVASLRNPAARAILDEAGFCTDQRWSYPMQFGPAFWEIVFLSLRIATVATVIALPVAVGVAWVLARKRFWGHGLLNGIVHLPLVLPPVVTGYLLLIVFGRNGPVGGVLYDLFGITLAFRWTGAALAAAIMAFPLMVRAIRLGFEAVDRGVEDAAATLGASPFKVFRTVTLPLIAPGVLAGAVLGFAKALGEFGATITFVAAIPGQTQTIPSAIYGLLQVPGQEGAVVSLVVVSIISAMGALIVSEWLANRMAKRIAA